jgi:3alpha(or 20beta)-hydroxysteroid dehydrogenase
VIGLGANIAHGTSKLAIRGLTKMAAVDVARTSAASTLSRPGTVQTPMTGDLPESAVARQPIDWIAEPAEISRLVLFLAIDEASFHTCAKYAVDRGSIFGEGGLAHE